MALALALDLALALVLDLALALVLALVLDLALVLMSALNHGHHRVCGGERKGDGE